MRIFVSFDDVVHAVDVDIGVTVGEIKKLLQGKFGLSLNNSRNENDSYVSLIHQGAGLHDHWVYSDLGIASGSTLVCRMEKRIEPTLTVFCSRYEDVVELKASFSVWQTLVSAVRVMIQDLTGIHVSAFRLYSSTGVELFDCHPLKVYGIATGDSITMEIWRDVGELVRAARANDITDTLRALASFHEAPFLLRFQLQLGLFTAAHFGFHQLASQLIKCGARPNEPVGQHPSREWCREISHPDNLKTPSHEAAQYGRITCLHHFLMFNRSVLICKDANGLTPCNIARRYRQTECFKLLVAEQFRIPTVSDLSLHVYARVRKWCDRARARARMHKDKTALLLLTNAEVARKGAIVGQRVAVDGYNERIHQQHENMNVSRVEERIETSTSRSSNSSGKSDGIHGQNHSSNVRSSKRPTKSAVSVSSGSSAKSHNRKYTGASLKENHHSSSKGERYASFSAAKPKENQTHSMTVTDRPTFAVRQKTNNSPSKQCAMSASTPSRLNTSPSKNEAAENSQNESKGRYVWKSFEGRHEPVDDVVDKLETNDSMTKEDKRPSTKHTPRSRDVMGKSVANEHHLDRNRETYESTKCWSPKEESYREKTRKIHRMTHPGDTRRPSSEGQPAAAFFVDEGICDSRSHLNGTSQSNRLADQLSLNSADKCLRLASETFPRKSWLGQVQMALVVNTNMCKRRQSDIHKLQRGTSI